MEIKFLWTYPAENEYSEINLKLSQSNTCEIFTHMMAVVVIVVVVVSDSILDSIVAMLADGAHFVFHCNTPRSFMQLIINIE